MKKEINKNDMFKKCKECAAAINAEFEDSSTYFEKYLNVGVMQSVPKSELDTNFMFILFDYSFSEGLACNSSWFENPTREVIDEFKEEIRAYMEAVQQC